MNFDNDLKKSLDSDDENTGPIPSSAKLKRIIGTSPAYRMLTPYEIELLRKSKREMAQVVREVLAREKNPRVYGGSGA